MISLSPPPAGTARDADAAELARLGIARVKSENFRVGPYRYTNLADAIVRARRGGIAEKGV